MTLFRVFMRVLCLALLGLPLSGCYPVGGGPADEEKDPHFLAGKNRLNNMDYEAAIDAFENALSANPKSAAAHLELGLLYEERKGDYAAAIHHFQRHLQLRPESNMAETIKQRIFSCKLELAKTVSFTLVSRQVQDEIRRLYATNSTLHEVIEQLQSQLAVQAASYSNRLALVQQATAPAPQSQYQPPETDRRALPSERTPAPAVMRSPPRPVVSSQSPRSHIIRPGETLATIARKYNIKVSTLQMANPAVDARKIKAGQVLILPTKN